MDQINIRTHEDLSHISEKYYNLVSGYMKPGETAYKKIAD